MPYCGCSSTVTEPIRRPAVEGIYVGVGIVAAALLVYLLVALLKPEWF